MKGHTKKILAILIMTLVSSNVMSQPEPQFGGWSNTPSEFEKISGNSKEEIPAKYYELEDRHKTAMENGNGAEALAIENEMNKIRSGNSAKITVHNSPRMKIVDKLSPEEEQDWLSQNVTMYNGSIGNAPGYSRNTDVKVGEDGNIYMACIWRNVTHESGIAFFKSVNNGLSWNYVKGFYYDNYYIGNVSLLVESRNNSVADSTRLIAFYNVSSTPAMDNASVYLFSTNSKGIDYVAQTIATPPSGKEYSHLCAISDGAFYENATYFGVIFTESSNDLSVTSSIRYFRTVNWGATWTNSTINTSYNDFYPSAQLKRSTPDSIYIALERKFSGSNSHVRIISTPFSPSSSYSTYFLTSGSSFLYSNPVLAIKQNSPVDTMMVTFRKNNKAYMMASYNGGNLWSDEFDFIGSPGNNVSFVHCSSVPGGSRPFAIVWQSLDGDTIGATVGQAYNIHTAKKFKTNNTNAFAQTSPVSAVINKSEYGFGLAAFCGTVSGTTAQNIYCNQDGMKVLYIKMAIQGLYNASLNNHRRADTVTAYLRIPVAPYTIIDSARSVLSANDFSGVFTFSRVHSSSYQISVSHRNSIETWGNCSPCINFNANDSGKYIFSQYSYSAYGSNHMLVDNSPITFATYSGDVNQDETIDATDVSLIDNKAASFASGYIREDLTGDDFVDGSDFLIADNNAFEFISVVHP